MNPISTCTWFVLIAFCQDVAPPSRSIPSPNLPPESLFARLAKQTGEKLELIDREKDLLSDAKEGKLRRVSLAEAALLASGLRDELVRKKYLDRVEALEKDVRRAVVKAKTPFDKGQQLLKWLHAGPMANGYARDQDHLPLLLEEGKFNCVSSTVLYNILGQRLGLDLRAIVSAAHVFSVQYEGGVSKDVQTTNRDGYDWKEKHPLRREVGDLGLLAAVYRNTAARMNKEARYPEMVRAAVFAQTLEPKQGDLKARDIESAFHNWYVFLARKKQYADGLAVLALGLEVLPDNDLLELDRRSAYQQMTKAHRDKGEWEAGAKVCLGAVTAHPNDRGLVEDAETHYLLWARAHPSKAVELLQEGLAALPKSARLKSELKRVQKEQMKRRGMKETARSSLQGAAA